MWHKFDLTGNEIMMLCAIAEKPDLKRHAREFYDGLRKSIFERLEWCNSLWLKSWRTEQENMRLALANARRQEEQENDDENAQASGGTSGTGEGTETITLPELDLYILSVNDELLGSLKRMRRVWAPIDVVHDSVWTRVNGMDNKWLRCIASRMFTYAIVDIKNQYEKKVISVTEKTRM